MRDVRDREAVAASSVTSSWPCRRSFPISTRRGLTSAPRMAAVGSELHPPKPFPAGATVVSVIVAPSSRAARVL
jgi:hypothetical protein